MLPVDEQITMAGEDLANVPGAKAVFAIVFFEDDTSKCYNTVFEPDTPAMLREYAEKYEERLSKSGMN